MNAPYADDFLIGIVLLERIVHLKDCIAIFVFGNQNSRECILIGVLLAGTCQTVDGTTSIGTSDASGGWYLLVLYV